MNILLTSCGRRGYLVEYFTNVLHPQGGKVFAANSIYTHALSRADGYFLSPGIYDDTYIDSLLTYAEAHDISAIISLFDIDLPILAANRSRFEQKGIKLVVSDLRITELCNDKWATACYLKKIGLPHPRTFLSLEEAVEELSYPIIVKPRWGMGSIGVQKAETEEELRVLYKKVEREIMRTYLKFESQMDRENCVLIQECLLGDEYGLDVVNDLQGQYVNTIVKHKLAMRSGETDIAEIVDIPELSSYGRQLSEALQHIANLDVDCFIAKGKAYVLELNCRFGGQYPFSHIAGADLPRQIVRWLQGGETVSEWCSATIGIKACKEITPVLM